MKGRIEIDPERCKGCRYCVSACPRDIIGISREFNKLGFFYAVAESAESCTGCGFCAVVCPDVAIEVWREEAAKEAAGWIPVKPE